MKFKPTTLILLSIIPFLGNSSFGQSPYSLDNPNTVFDVGVGTESITINLKEYIGLDVSGRIVRFETPSGIMDLELFEEEAPLTVQNFLNYVERGDYDDSIFHRLEHNFVLQGGGYTFGGTDTLSSIETDPVVNNEYGVLNTLGTIAMAKTLEVDSATSQWFFNLNDNSTILDTSNSGGFTVFGEVIGDGLFVLDDLAFWGVLDLFNIFIPWDTSIYPPFTQLPLNTYDSDIPTKDEHSLIDSIREIGAFPGDHDGGSVVVFSASSGNEGLVQAEVVDSNLVLTITPNLLGEAQVTVVASDSGFAGEFLQLQVIVDAVAPTIFSQPTGRTIENGMSVPLVVEASGGEPYTYEWSKNGSILADSNSSSIFVSEVGLYTAKVTNDVGTVTSEEAEIVVVDSLGTLVNVSTRGYVGTGHQAMIAGVVVSGVDDKDLLLRGVSEGLSNSGLNGLLADSNVTVYDGAVLTDSNDNWGDLVFDGDITSVFTAVGASEFLDDSKDSAIVHSVSNGARTLVLNGVDDSEGLALVEVYDAAQDVTSRIVNLSTRAMVKDGDGVAIVGFVIGGDGPVNVLIRGGSDALKSEAVLENEPILDNPNLALVSNGAIVAQNLDWDDTDSPKSMISIQNEVGAIPFEVGSNDSLLYLTLEPGIYSAVLAGGEGLGLVEIFEVR